LKSFSVLVAGYFAWALVLIGCMQPPPAYRVEQRPPYVAPPTPAPSVSPVVPVDPPEPAVDQQRGAQYPTGYVPNPEESRRYLQSLPNPELRDAAPHFFQARGPPAAFRRAATKEPILLYRALDYAHKAKFGRPFLVGKQLIGDCTSWGYGHGVDILAAIDFVQGRSGDFDLAATEAIYGLGRVEGAGVTYRRGGDGSYGSAMVKGLTRYGALWKRDYSSLGLPSYDLRTYSGPRARDWGAYGCGGRDDRGRLDAEAKRHGIKQVALVATWDETVAALSNGYPIPVCSGQGFTYSTDEHGFARASGSWSHCMCAIGVRFDIEGVLILNSWGPDWINQSRGRHPADQPRGSFWCSRKTWERMIAGRDSYAISNLVGFPRQELLLVKGL